jgi:hypothetical protein
MAIRLPGIWIFTKFSGWLLRSWMMIQEHCIEGSSLTEGCFSSSALVDTSGPFQINVFGVLQIRHKSLDLFDPVTGWVSQNELQQTMNYLVIFEFLKYFFSRIMVCQRQEFPEVKISRCSEWWKQPILGAAGRGKIDKEIGTYSAIKAWSLEKGIPVLQETWKLPHGKHLAQWPIAMPTSLHLLVMIFSAPNLSLSFLNSVSPALSLVDSDNSCYSTV